MNDNILEFEMVTCRMEDGIAVVTLKNGKQNKLISPDFLDLDVFKEWIEKNHPVGLIICGNGRHFSSGADVEEIMKYKDNSPLLHQKISKGKEILEYIENLPLITVAAISGMCCGGGSEIALACQFRFATNVAVFAFPEANLGLIPGLGGTVRLSKTVGRNKAIQMIVSAENYMSEEAYQWGLVDKITDKKDYFEQAKAFIMKISAGREEEHRKQIISCINSGSYEKETEIFIQRLQQS